MCIRDSNVTVPEIIPDKTANITNPNFGDNVTYTAVSYTHLDVYKRQLLETILL